MRRREKGSIDIPYGYVDVEKHFITYRYIVIPGNRGKSDEDRGLAYIGAGGTSKALKNIYQLDNEPEFSISMSNYYPTSLGGAKRVQISHKTGFVHHKTGSTGSAFL